MTAFTQAKDIGIKDVESQFNLRLSADRDFFREWQVASVSITDIEEHQLERLQRNYQNLSRRKNFSEESVKMVVLSPLLDLAGFYQAPFELATEEPIEVVSVDEGTTVRGKIDALIVQNRFWALVIESKSTRYDVLTALPQALIYMLSSPEKSQPTYGFLVNGREFVFVKLSHKPDPIYDRSFALSIERGDELAQVLGVLKYIRQEVLEAD